jgi:hypothetical protein
MKSAKRNREDDAIFNPALFSSRLLQSMEFYKWTMAWTAQISEYYILPVQPSQPFRSTTDSKCAMSGRNRMLPDLSVSL